jgi:hypothetical protein
MLQLFILLFAIILRRLVSGYGCLVVSMLASGTQVREAVVNFRAQKSSVFLRRESKAAADVRHVNNPLNSAVLAI